MGRREIHFNCLDSLINLVDSKTLQDNQLTIKDNGHNNLNLIEVEPVDKDVEERFEQNENQPSAAEVASIWFPNRH